MSYLRGAALCLLALASVARAWPSDAFGASRHGTTPAHTARALQVRDEGHLHFVQSSGARLLDEGPASGTIPGRVRVSFLYNGQPTVTARLTVYVSNGTLSARASARLSNPTSSTPSFRGSLTITGGTGRFRHARGHGELFGVFQRRSYGMVVQVIGTLQH